MLWHPKDNVMLIVLGWVGEKMIWLIMCWVLMSVLCYLVLNHLGTRTTDDSTKITTHMDTTFSTLHNVSGTEWTNELIAWLFNNFLKVPEPLEAWIKSLNDAAKKVNKPTECEVIFNGFGDHSHVKASPKLSNIRVEHGPREHLTLKTNIHLPCVCLKVVSSQRTPESLLVSNFDVNIMDLRGEIECRFACIANQIFVMGCFNGRPEMDIELKNTDFTASTQVSLGLVEEKIRRCLLSAVTNISLSESFPLNPDESRIGDHYMTNAFNENMQHNQFDIHNPLIGSPHTVSYAPQSNMRRSTGNQTTVQSQVPELFKKLNETHLMSPSTNIKTESNKLRVKVIKASHLGRGIGLRDVQQPYVVLEIDEPAQKFTTSKGLNTCPFWEESFDFDLTSASEELLFEVYDAIKVSDIEEDKNFLGLAIVNLQEIKNSCEHIHTLKLQGRPYRKDEVSGELTAVFDFYYNPKVMTAGKLVDAVKIRNSNGSEFREIITDQRRAVYDPHDHFDNAEITPTRTTTVLLKTVSQQLKERPTIQSVHGSMENTVETATQHAIDHHLPNDDKHSEVDVSKMQCCDHTVKAYKNTILTTSSGAGANMTPKIARPPPPPTSDLAENQGKVCLTFTCLNRSRSVEIHGSDIEEAVSLPPSRDASRTRTARQRYYESQSVGGKSGESGSSLYKHSTLVLELEHEKQLKYFLIPQSMINEPATCKLMRRGKKLHIYNEHTFVAVKIQGQAVICVKNGTITCPP
ncbi:C2 domain protein [Dictyocaulus viviparus]|uniref:C2 domain protein n=1 Tax=Dictyocaulus viviparus TaxID=29172 RepID=A0A0D8XAJ3_DICVI|nr:C2 domain protein [Dictyocaulus viviparus]